MEKNTVISIILVGFITILIGLFLVPIISDQVNQVSNGVSASVVNENVAEGVGNAGGRFQLSHPNIVSVFYVTNSSNTSGMWNGTSFYYFDNYGDQLRGIISINGLSDNTSGFFVTYDYGTSSYVNDGASRNLMPIILLFFVLAVALIAFVYFYDEIKEML